MRTGTDAGSGSRSSDSGTEKARAARNGSNLVTSIKKTPQLKQHRHISEI